MVKYFQTKFGQSNKSILIRVFLGAFRDKGWEVRGRGKVEVSGRVGSKNEKNTKKLSTELITE